MGEARDFVNLGLDADKLELLEYLLEEEGIDGVDQPLPRRRDLAEVFLLDLDCRVAEDGERLRHPADLVMAIAAGDSDAGVPGR